MKTLGLVAWALLMVPLNAWALQHLWRWFVVPLGMQPLGLWHAAGVSLVVGYLAVGTTIYKDHERDFAAEVWGMLMRPLFALGIGAIYAALMQ